MKRLFLLFGVLWGLMFSLAVLAIVGNDDINDIDV